MNTVFDLLAFDDDGALEETADAVGVSRADLLRKAAIGGGALLASSALMGLLPGVASAARPRAPVTSRSSTTR